MSEFRMTWEEPFVKPTPIHPVVGAAMPMSSARSPGTMDHAKRKWGLRSSLWSYSMKSGNCNIAEMRVWPSICDPGTKNARFGASSTPVVRRMMSASDVFSKDSTSAFVNKPLSRFSKWYRSARRTRAQLSLSTLLNVSPKFESPALLPSARPAIQKSALSTSSPYIARMSSARRSPGSFGRALAQPGPTTSSFQLLYAGNPILVRTVLIPHSPCSRPRWIFVDWRSKSPWAVVEPESFFAKQ
mmetsp:Transcript_54606/g.157999  ORF Transcript_54606/g.157999 Transcript_54606/m.157999 type:complete len:243 (+) Transcript_54606:3518-4246(+)